MKKRMCFMLLLMSCSLCLCFMSNTYSRYVAGTTSNIDILFAKWQILVNDQDISNGTNSEITFTPIIEPNENVAEGKVAPTSKGYFDIDIDPTNVDVSFKYVIDLAIENEEIPDLMITKYSILPSDYVEGDEVLYIDLVDNHISNSLIFDSNTSDFSFDSFTVRVYFEWYDGEDEQMNDDDDTLVGNDAADEELSFVINASIAFEQIVDIENP